MLKKKKKNFFSLFLKIISFYVNISQPYRKFFYFLGKLLMRKLIFMKILKKIFLFNKPHKEKIIFFFFEFSSKSYFLLYLTTSISYKLNFFE
jgi:hypothetical protein